MLDLTHPPAARGVGPGRLAGPAVFMLLVANGWYQYSRRINRQQPEMVRRRDAFQRKRSKQERVIEVLHDASTVG